MSTKEKESHVTASEKCIRRIEKENAPLAKLFASLLRAAVGSVHTTRGVRGDASREAVIIHLRQSIEGFQAQDMPIYAEAAKRRLGQLLNNGEGIKLLQSADDWMLAQRIVNRDRMTSLVLPGDFAA